MLFKHSAYGDEKGFLVIKNVEASSITTGMGVAIRVGTTASFDGTQSVRAASGNALDLPGFMGIAVKDIASNAYGLVQNFGNAASVLISVVNSSITITNGDPLVPSASAGALFSAAPTYATSGFGFVLASNISINTLSATAAFYASGFVRCIH